jgi:hypothetical protein
MYSRILRGIVKDYVRDNELVDDELKTLWRIIATVRA